MKIIDKKIEQKVYLWSELSQGEVYKDSDNGYIVIAASFRNVVDLSDGATYERDDFGADVYFTLVNAVLEIQ